MKGERKKRRHDREEMNEGRDKPKKEINTGGDKNKMCKGKEGEMEGRCN